MAVALIKRHSSVFLLFVTLIFVSTSSFAKPFLWKAIEPSSGTTVYLFGTIHSGNPELNKLDDVVIDSFEASKTLLTEVDLSAANVQLMQQQMFTPSAKPLRQILGDERILQVNKALTLLNKNLHFELFQQLPLWAFVANLSFLEDQVRFPGQTPMDMALHQAAISQQMTTNGLETIDEQLEIFTGLSELELLEILDASISVMIDYFSVGKSPMDELYSAYLSGDENAFERLMNEQIPLNDELSEKLFYRLITARNIKMADRLVIKANQLPQPIFVAIGAGHLDAKGGVQKLLEKKGWQVERLAN